VDGELRVERTTVKDFKDLDAWKVAMRLAKEIYKISANFPESEKFGLVSQLRRSAVSVASNIAEGYARGSRQDYIRFLRMARGSLAETETQVLLAGELGYMPNPEGVLGFIQDGHKLLHGLLKSLEK
jgi:four helix bundle protein